MFAILRSQYDYVWLFDLDLVINIYILLGSYVKVFMDILH